MYFCNTLNRRDAENPFHSTDLKMDKYFEPINKLYLSQPFAERGDEYNLKKVFKLPRRMLWRRMPLCLWAIQSGTVAIVSLAAWRMCLGCRMASVVLQSHHFMRSSSLTEPIRTISCFVTPMSLHTYTSLKENTRRKEELHTER